MTSNGLIFDPEKHEYKLGGHIVPSVTQVIRAVVPGWQAEQFFKDRGKAVHHACRLLDEGRLDWSTVADEIMPRVEAWGKFRATWPAQPLLIEQPLASETYRFAGTLDRLFATPLDTDTVLCDLKNTVEPQVKLQLGGYSLLTKSANTWRAGAVPKADRAVAVELREDGTFKCLWLDKHKLRRAEQQFLNVLGTFNFLAEHNLLPKETG